MGYCRLHDAYNGNGTCYACEQAETRSSYLKPIERAKEAEADRDRLVAENEKLREALDKISYFDCTESYTRAGCGECPSCIANAALNEMENKSAALGEGER